MFPRRHLPHVSIVAGYQAQSDLVRKIGISQKIFWSENLSKNEIADWSCCGFFISASYQSFYFCNEIQKKTRKYGCKQNICIFKDKKTPTSLSRNIDAAQEKIKYDKYVKAILKNRQVLLRIFQRVVPEVKGLSLPEIEDCIEKTELNVSIYPGLSNLDQIQGIDTESAIGEKGKATFDVRTYIMVVIAWFTGLNQQIRIPAWAAILIIFVMLPSLYETLLGDQ